MKLPDKLSFSLPAITEKNRYYVIGAILVVIFLLDYFAIIRPQLKSLSKLGPKISILVKDIKQSKADIKEVGHYQQEVAKLQDKMGRVGSKILSKEEIPLILDQISRVASQNKIQINQITPIKEAQTVVLTNSDGKYYAIPVSIIARGRYHDIGRFLNKIESDRIFMTLIDFSIAATNDDSTLQALKATIKAFILDRTATKNTE